MIASAGKVALHRVASPVPVRAIVRRAWRALVVRRIFEATAVAAAALIACVAAAVRSGADPLHAEAWVAAGVVGWLAWGSWWLEHRPREAAVARRLDRDGALVTAFECEIRGSPTRVQELLSRRVAHDLAARGPPRVARAPALAILAAPLAAGALLALALEGGESISARAIRARTRALAEHANALVAAVEDDQEALSTEDSEAVRELARSAAALASTNAAVPALADLESRAWALAAGLSKERVRVRRALEEAAARAGDLADLLARNGAPGIGLAASPSGLASGERASPREAVPDPAASRGSAIAGPGQGAPAGGESRTGMAAGPADVTMPRLDPDQRGAPAPDPAAAPASEQGLSAVRWWPRRFDTIVERWVERQRTSSDR